MNPARWDLIKEHFWRILESPVDERDAALRALDAADPELGRQVRDLIERDANERDKDEAQHWNAGEFLGLAGEAVPDLVVPGYRVGALLGSGLTADVYRAAQLDVGRDVALKVFKTAVDSESAEQIAKEIAALARLSHPCIAQVMRAGVASRRGTDAPYLAMELVEGPTLTAFARAKGAGLKQKVSLLERVCGAVQHAHGCGVIHRDLKPQNVLVDERSGEDGSPKVLDFGLSSVIGGHDSRRYRFAGTPAYMAPERFHSETNEPDVRADVYSLGAIGYELLTGEPPAVRRGMTLPEAIAAVEKFDPSPRLAPHGDFGAVVLRAMARDPDTRYQSAAEFGADLRRVLAGEAVSVRSHEQLYLLRMTARRRPILSAMIGAGLVTMALALMLVATSNARVRRALDESSAMARTLLTETADNLADRVGANSARRRTLEQLLPKIERYASLAPDDRAVQMDYSRVLQAMGDLEADQAHFFRAESLMRQVVKIREAIVSTPPATPNEWAMLSVALVRVGDIAGAHRQTAEQRKQYERALEIDRQLSLAHPSSPRLVSNLAFSCERMGDLARQERNLPLARQYQMQQQALAGQLETLGEDPLKAKWAVVSARAMLPNLLDLEGRTEEAIALRKRILSDLEELVQSDSGSRPYRIRLSDAHLAVANAFRAGSDARAALQHAERAVQVLAPLEAADTQDAVVVATLAGAWGSLARQRIESGDVAGALDAENRAEIFLDDLLRVAPESAPVLRTAANVRLGAADVYRAAGRAEASLRAWKKHLAHIREFTVLSDWPRDRVDLAAALGNPDFWSRAEAEEAASIAREFLPQLDAQDTATRNMLGHILDIAYEQFQIPKQNPAP